MHLLETAIEHTHGAVGDEEPLFEIDDLEIRSDSDAGNGDPKFHQKVYYNRLSVFFVVI